MTIRVASAPVSWGIYEFEGITPKFTYTRVLDEIAQTGYTGLELGPYGYLPTDPTILGAALAQRGLTLLSAFVPVNLVDATAHAAGATSALTVGKLLKALGARYIVLADDNGKVPELVQQAGQRVGSKLNSAEWDIVAAGVELIAERLAGELGMEVVFHHHCGGYVETAEEVRQLLARTNSDRVGLCLDTGHWHFAGGDAVKGIAEFGDRIRYLHLKDCEPTIAAQVRAERQDYFGALAAGVFCQLGMGAVDFPGVIAAMTNQGYDGWAIVEQDILTDDPETPRRISQANRDYLHSIGL